MADTGYDHSNRRAALTIDFAGACEAFLAALARGAAKLSNRAMRAWICMMLFATACKGTPDCASAVSGAVDRMIANAHATMPPAAAANVARLRDPMKRFITDACVDDHWADSVVACIARAGTQHELDACDKQLTKDQRDSEHKHMDEIVKAANEPMGVQPRAGSAGSAR
jgi:hypothetical protein